MGLNPKDYLANVFSWSQKRWTTFKNLPLQVFGVLFSIYVIGSQRLYKQSPTVTFTQSTGQSLFFGSPPPPQHNGHRHLPLNLHFIENLKLPPFNNDFLLIFSYSVELQLFSMKLHKNHKQIGQNNHLQTLYQVILRTYTYPNLT